MSILLFTQGKQWLCSACAGAQEPETISAITLLCEICNGEEEVDEDVAQALETAWVCAKCKGHNVADAGDLNYVNIEHSEEDIQCAIVDGDDWYGNRGKPGDEGRGKMQAVGNAEKVEELGFGNSENELLERVENWEMKDEKQEGAKSRHDDIGALLACLHCGTEFPRGPGETVKARYHRR